MPGPDEDRLSTVVLEAGTDAELEPVLQSAISFEGEAFGLSVRLPDELGAPAVRMLPMRGTSTLHHPPGSVPIAEALAKGEECIRIVESAVGDAVSLNVPGMIENMESVMASVNGGDSERKTKDDLDLLEGKLHQLAQLCRRQKLISLPIESVCEAANVIPLFEAVFPMIDQVNGTISALRSMEASTMALASVNGRNTSMMSSQEAATVYAKALSNRDAIRKASESTLAREKAIVAFVSQLTETTEVLRTLRAKCGHDED